MAIHVYFIHQEISKDALQKLSSEPIKQRPTHLTLFLISLIPTNSITLSYSIGWDFNYVCLLSKSKSILNNKNVLPLRIFKIMCGNKNGKEIQDCILWTRRSLRSDYFQRNKIGVYNISKSDFITLFIISHYNKRFWLMKFVQFKFIFLKRKKQGKKSSWNDVQIKYEMNYH